MLFNYREGKIGSQIGFLYREASDAKGEFGKYLFTKNPQDDILKVYKDSGELAVEYLYDAWGAIIDISVTTGYQKIADANCLLYRGYYYDFETGYYYLNSRYYDPQVKRFISPDNVNYLGANDDFVSFNLYAYCSNNPVMYSDPMGLWTFSIGVGISAWFIAGSYIQYNIVIDDNWNLVIQKSEADLYGEHGMVLGFVGADASVKASITNQDTVYDLEGKGMDFFGVQVNSNGGDVIGYSYSVMGASVGYTSTITESITTTEYDSKLKGFFGKIKEKWSEFWD